MIRIGFTAVAVLALLFLSDRGSVSVHSFVVVSTLTTRPIRKVDTEEPSVSRRPESFRQPSVQENKEQEQQQQQKSFPRLVLFSSTEGSDDEIATVIQDDDARKEALQQDLMDSVTDEQINQLLRLRDLVVDRNQRINLVSRKDCTPQTVWERHILPCVAAAASGDDNNNSNNNKTVHQLLQQARSVVDVGTGGGFPGLPLAILYPNVQFTLLDSVGKKLSAVQDMADQLSLSNVKTHHGRAEDLRIGARKFDVATGRSVASLDSFCAWMHHLLVLKTGTLLYWIGGDIDPAIHDRATADLSIASELLPSNQLSPLALDKRILVFPQSAVTQIARESGIVVKPVVVQQQREPPQRTNNNSNNKKPKDKTAKGAWVKKRNDPDVPKERGYEGFKRYSLSSGSS